MKKSQQSKNKTNIGNQAITSTDFIKRLAQYYREPDHEIWRNNIQQAVNRVEGLLEDNFWDNHFKYLEYKNGSIKTESYYKFHQGLWHLHVASFLATAGYSLEKPTGQDDIVATTDNQKIYVECVCPGWGDKPNPIRETYRDMSSEFTEISGLNDKLVYKLSKNSIEDKNKQIKKRKDKTPGVYILAINEGLLVNGFRKWNSKDTVDRLEQIIAEMNGSVSFDAMIYGCVFEGEYCQPRRGLMMVRTMR